MTENVNSRTIKVMPLSLADVRTRQDKAIDNQKLLPMFTQPKYDTGISIDPKNPTTQTILDEIANSGGKIPFSTFMDISLYGPDGYYQVKVGIGNDKDFTTSVESTNIFGAVIGKTAMKVWEAMGRPAKFQIIEMGAGQASLAQGLLHWSKTFNPEFYQALQYTILEYSNGLIPKQQKRINEFQDKTQWVKGSAYNLPFAEIEGIFVSNELPDAFPVERVTMLHGKLRQKYVTVENNKWVEVWDDPSEEVQRYVQDYGLQIQEGIEEPVNLNAIRLQKSLGRALKKGAILTIDYGKDGQVGEKNVPAILCYGKIGDNETLRGFSKDRPFPEYEFPGQFDITASINFGILEIIAKRFGLSTDFSGMQKDLFLQVGITEIIKQIEKSFGKLSSWKEVLNLSNDLDNYIQIMYHRDYFYSHLLTKGLQTIIWESSDKDYFPKPPKYSIHIGLPNTACTVDMTRTEKWKRHVLALKQETDKDGNLWLFPDQIIGSKIIGPDGRILLDLTNPSQAEQVIQSLGYSLE